VLFGTATAMAAPSGGVRAGLSWAAPPGATKIRAGVPATPGNAPGVSAPVTVRPGG
jgi:hypothetical protein